MSFGRFALVLGMAGALAGGCTVTQETTQVTPDPYPDVATFCAKLATAICNANVVTACYGSDAASLPTDTQSCIDAYSQLAVCNPITRTRPRTASRSCRPPTPTPRWRRQSSRT